MTDQAQVYRTRLDRARTEMQTQGIDYLLVGPSSDLFYLIGFDAHLSERLNLLILPAQGEAQFVVPVLEAPTLPRLTRSLVRVHEWAETESPTTLVGSLIGEANNKQLAVSDQLWSGFMIKLQDGIEGARWTSALPVLKPLRVAKDQAEIDRLQDAATRTDEAWHEFVEGGQITGLTETAAMDKLATLMRQRGLEVSFGICASGPNSASPHHHTAGRVIQPGDVVIFDFGGRIDGYHSDVTRTVVIGEPTDEYRKVYEIVKRANQAALDAVKPGVACEDLDKAARDLISAAGYGDAFLHRVGHGLGLDVHEEPYLVGGNTTPLEEGMVFSDEPGIYLEGKFGVRIEDSVVVTPTGGRRLNEANREITVMD